MIDLSFEQIDDMLAAFKKGIQVANYHSPNYAFKTLSVLVPEDFVWEDIIVNCYGDDIPPVGIFTIVYHGHNRKTYCRNDYYCHVEGYRPTGEEKPGFLKGFRLKWPTYQSLHENTST